MVLAFTFLIFLIFFTIILYNKDKIRQRQSLLRYGKEVEKEAQMAFQMVAPKHWDYKFNLFKKEWHTDLDIYITYPFKCVIDIKSASGYVFDKNKNIVKKKDGKVLYNQGNIIRQLKITKANYIVIWCPNAREQSLYTQPTNYGAIIICNGDAYYLVSFLNKMFAHR